MSLAKKISLWVLAALLFLSLAACEPKTEEEFFKQADRLFEKGKFQQAVQVYTEYLLDHPNGKQRDKAMFRSGEILYYALGQRVAAVRQFSDLVQQNPSSDYAFKARSILADVFRDETHDYDRAILEYRWLLNQRPESPEAPDFQFKIARAYFMANDIEQATLEFGRFIEQYPGSDQIERAYDELGSAHMILGRPDQALFIFRRMLSLFPETPLRTTVEFKMGNCMEEMYRWSEALGIYRDLLDRYENRQAVEIRIAGVEARMKNKLGGVAPVDYGYRPKPDGHKANNQKKSK